MKNKMKNDKHNVDIIWLKAEENRLYYELKDAESINPDSIASYNLRNEYNDVVEYIDHFESNLND